MPRLFIYKIKYYGYIKTKFKQYEILNSWKIIRKTVYTMNGYIAVHRVRQTFLRLEFQKL